MFPLFAAAVLAAVSSPSPSPSASALPQIVRVVTSDRSEGALARATRVTHIVTHGDIVRMGYRTVGDALAAVPAVEIERYGGVGSNASYGIRGSNSSQVLVLIDGLPAPGSLANSVNLGTMSTAGVDRIEIVEGGGSTLYGTGAVGGIINVITDHAPPTSATLRWGSFGDRELQASAAGFSFERIVANNDYPVPGYASSGTPLAASRQNSAYQATTARYAGSHELGSVEADVALNVASTHGGEPGFYPFVSSTSVQNEVDEGGALTFRTHGRHSTATLQLGGTVQQIAFDCDQAVEPDSCFQPSQSLSVESRVNVGLRDAVDSRRQRLVYGVDLSRGTVMTNTGGGYVPVKPGSTPPPPVSTDALAQSAAYVEDVADLSTALRAHAGLRGERDGALGGEISPSLGLQAQLSTATSVKLNYATAFRAPDASELYYPGYGNPQLRPERAQVADLTLTDSRLLGGVSLGWFTNHTNDLIVPVLTAFYPPYTYIEHPENVSHAIMSGFTLEAKTQPYRGVSLTMNATDLYAALDRSTDSRLPNDPVVTVNVGFAIAAAPSGIFGGAGISQRLVGARGPVTPSLPTFFQPVAYADLDAFVALRLNRRLELFVRGYNLGDERYAEVSGYPMPGRSFALELKTK
jgi:vitamin B12 transporter